MLGILQHIRPTLANLPDGFFTGLDLSQQRSLLVLFFLDACTTGASFSRETGEYGISRPSLASLLDDVLLGTVFISSSSY